MFYGTQYKTYGAFVLAFQLWLQSKIADPYCTEAPAYVNNMHMVLYRPQFYGYLNALKQVEPTSD